MREINHSDVLDSIHYNPETGIFTRKKNSSHAKAGDVCCAINKKGYIEFNVMGQLVRSHRLAYFIMNGKWPELQIDHIDGDKTNNKWSNLREVNNKTNCENKKSINKNNSSGFTGVRKKNGKFESRIGIDGSLIYLGLFDSASSASEAYMQAKKKYHKGFKP